MKILKFLPSLICFFISVDLSASFVEGSASESHIESEGSTQKSYSDILSLDAQRYLMDLGHTVLQSLGQNEDIDFVKASYFDDLGLETFKSDVEYSSCAKLAFISNTVRGWFSSTDETYNKERKNRLTAIAGIMWAFTDLSNDKNSVFSRGAYTIIDPNHNISNFLLDYVKLVTGSEDPTQTHCALTQSNFAYRRLPEKGGSSHHSGRTPTGQFGIDLRFETTETLMKILPFSMAHVLFGKLDMGQEEKLLFVKPEPVGLGSKGEFLDHSLHFFHSGHVEGEARREKDIMTRIKGDFQIILDLSERDSSAKTVREMILSVEDIEEKEISDPLEHAMANFYEALESHYPNELHRIRTGNEVILDCRR